MIATLALNTPPIASPAGLFGLAGCRTMPCCHWQTHHSNPNQRGKCTVKRQVRGGFPVAGPAPDSCQPPRPVPRKCCRLDKPLIQYGVEEAVAARDTLVFIIGLLKNAIADHFDKAYELEVELETRGKTDLLEVVRNIAAGGMRLRPQAEALGLGHAVLCARPVVGNEPFAVILADDLTKKIPMKAAL